MMNKNEMNKPPISANKQIFRISDNEIYMIKEQNIKRIHDILKNSYTAKSNEECGVIIFLF